MTRILVVDDDAPAREAIAGMLRRTGYAVDQAAGLGEARERVQQNDYELVLADWVMPGGDGAETVHALKTLRPHLDVLVVTGYGTLESVLAAVRAGAVDFLFKPCNRESLEEAVRRTLARRAGRREHHERLTVNEMKDKFLALVSHELRTPLTLIYGYLVILQRQGDSLFREQNELLGIVLRATRKLSSLVDNIQTIAQAGRGEMPLHLQRLAAPKLVSDTLAEVKSGLQQRRLDMSIAGTAEECECFGDSLRLRQALHELLQNAVRNTPDGGRITCGCRGLEGHVVFWVRDTGIGIPLAEQGKIFEPFYEVADTSSHRSDEHAFHGGGIGLGLSLVKAVVEAHHGRIHLETECGRGTLIELHIPQDQETFLPDGLSDRRRAGDAPPAA